MRKHVVKIVVLALAALLVGGLAWSRLRPRPVAVTVAPAESGRVEATVANTRAGTIEARRRANVAPTTSGQVVTLPVERGTRVEAGALLLELRNDDLRAELAVAENRARAASGRADQTCVLARSAAHEAQRLERAGKRGVAAGEAVDRAAAEAEAQVAACRAARAEARQAAAAVDVTAAKLDRTRLTAPFAGVVAEVNAELGEIVSPSPPGIPTPPAVDLIDDSTLHATAPIDEIDAPKVRLGQPARITVDALPGRAFAGRVTRIAPYVLDVEKQARTVEVEAVFVDPAAAATLKPGYTADLEILLEARDGVVRIPTEAVLEGGRVLVVDGDGVLVAREVRIGVSNWEHTEIRDGLSPGDRVVVSVNRPGVEPGAMVVVEGQAAPRGDGSRDDAAAPTARAASEPGR